jgi:glucosamine-phosphate N-acetyltransferase
MSEEGPLSLRELGPADVDMHYFDLLKHLTAAPPLAADDFAAVLADMQRRGSRVFVIVDEAERRIAGTTTLLVERKLIRGGSLVGHIEDVVVHPQYQGRRLGQRLIEHACAQAKLEGCYKVILDSNESSAAFYEKCGFFRKELQMRRDL